MIDMSILWALVLALFALNREPSNERTERWGTRSVANIRQTASRRRAHRMKRDSRSYCCNYRDGLPAGYANRTRRNLSLNSNMPKRVTGTHH